MLNREICLQCCYKQRIQNGLTGGLNEYAENFWNEWASGIFFCEHFRFWMRNREDAKSTTMAMDKKRNEKLINDCPYILEHTINAK